MIVEMHSHTSEHSPCSHVAAADLVRRVCDVGIGAIVLTDHHYQWSDEELSDLRRRTGLPDSFQILAGQEVEVGHFGHMLIYGATAAISTPGLPLARIREENPDAAVVWAHPYRDKRLPSPDRLLDPLVDAIEIFSSNYTVVEATRALQAWHQYKFTAIAGTDTHGLSYAGSYPTLFDHPFDSIGAMAAEIRAGRCRPYFKEVPLSGTSHTRITEVTIGREETEIARTVVVKTFDTPEAWSTGQRSRHVAEQLLAHGFDRGLYRVVRSIDEDPHSLSIVEERAPGRTLFEALTQAEPAETPRYMEMAAQWLAKLHNARLTVTPRDEYLQIEPEQLDYYLRSLVDTGNRHLERVREIKDRVLEDEKKLIENSPEILVQGHGDYHARNLFVGREDPDEPEYMIAIDLGSSYQLPRAFDVGTFLAQYVSMFLNEREVQQNAPSDIFLRTYLAHAEVLEDNFTAQVNLYKARTCLSILYYLAKIGMGESENFWRVLVEAERSLAYVAVEGLGVSA